MKRILEQHIDDLKIEEEIRKEGLFESAIVVFEEMIDYKEKGKNSASTGGQFRGFRKNYLSQ